MSMPAMSAVEHVQEWTEEEKQKGPISQQVRAMLGEEKKPGNSEEADQNKSASRSKKVAARL
jgi:glycerol-3-phosphate dehydrogenase